MKTLLSKLHARLGDLWWYSLMIFVACRSGDVIQAFIGLWLVPKYVGQKELGAVLPLQQLSSLFTVPLAILATVFAKYVNTYATRGEYGKVKCFIRDVLLASAVVFVFCIAAAYLIIPHFYVRLNVASGMLTVLILVSGFIGNVNSLFSSALQGLKKFRTMTIQNLIGAPIRLVTLLIAMPFRALSGYILGQTTPPATCSVLAAYSLHKDLKPHSFDTTWRSDLPEIWRYFWPIAVYTGFGSLFCALMMTVYRQRLPGTESAAYYMLSRFAEIATYISGSVSVVLVPLASEAHESGKNPIRLLKKTLWGIIVSAMALTILFYFTSSTIVSLNATWNQYEPYSYLLPHITIIYGLNAAIGTCISFEMACRRFTAAFTLTAINGIWIAFIIAFSGYEFFRGCVPDSIVNWMASLHIADLKTLMTIGIPFGFFQLIYMLFAVCRYAPPNPTLQKQ